MNYGLHWFRRDLRLYGNPALMANFKKNDGKVLGIFCFDKKFLSRADFSINRFQFFLNTLKDLRDQLRLKGGDLIVMDIGPDEAFEKFFSIALKNKVGIPTTVSFNKDYEPFAKKRDARLKAIFEDKGIEIIRLPDHLLIEPEKLAPSSGNSSFYKVYSPFSRSWLNVFQSPEVQKRIEYQAESIIKFKNEHQIKEELFKLKGLEFYKNQVDFPDYLEIYSAENSKRVNVRIPEAGMKAGLSKIDSFKKYLNDYSKNRDFPSVRGTSGLSIFLKNGSLTVAQVIAAYNLDYYPKGPKSARANYFSELIWREFYYHILHHRPDVEKEVFNEKYKALAWPGNEELFELWKEGKTGYPIVDAAMRQLNKTGWMHNRLRMISASFLCKHLLLDYRLGERYFMEKLLDGDLAPNNGGWQWSASTGCDAQPYFRIFNPWSQSKKFDADGSFIKKYVPELSSIPAKALHEPILLKSFYPAPVVEHKLQREKAIMLFKELS